MLHDTPEEWDTPELEQYADAKAMLLRLLRQNNPELDVAVACSDTVADSAERVKLTLVFVEDTATGQPTSFRLSMGVKLNASEEHRKTTYGTLFRKETENVYIADELLRTIWGKLPAELRDAIARNVIAEAEHVLTQNFELHNQYGMIPALCDDLCALYKKLVPEAAEEPDV